MAQQREHFLLKLYINEAEYPELREKYTIACDAHNTKLIPYFTGKDIDFDAGFDLFLPKPTTIPAGAYSTKNPHGIHCSMLRCSGSGSGRGVGYYLYVRSSTGAKTPLRLSNHVGIIDAPYRGEIIALFDNLNATESVSCDLHQRLVQICAPDLSYPIVVKIVDNKEDLGITERGEGGFGSTGQ